MKPSTYSL